MAGVGRFRRGRRGLRQDHREAHEWDCARPRPKRITPPAGGGSRRATPASITCTRRFAAATPALDPRCQDVWRDVDPDQAAHQGASRARLRRAARSGGRRSLESSGRHDISRARVRRARRGRAEDLVDVRLARAHRQDTQPDRHLPRSLRQARAKRAVVETDEFETADPALRGEMTITISLSDANGGTELVAIHDGLPRGVSRTTRSAGTRRSRGSQLTSSRLGDRYLSISSCKPPNGE